MRKSRTPVWGAWTGAVLAGAALWAPWAAHGEKTVPREPASEERAPGALERLAEADLNSEGGLTREEVRDVRGRRRPAATAADREQRLRRWLERFPESDLNGDGVLSEEEAREFRAKRPGGGGPPPDHADVRYGPDPANVLDLWLAESERPTPLVIHIHGGGFRQGDKRQAAGNARSYLAEGISLASINYRMLPDHRFPVPLHDAARAVQYLRSRAGEWNIDPGRIGLTGGSAGAGTSLWIAFRDDLADPRSDDPVLRQSTRVTCAVVSGAQTSYDARFCAEHGLEGLTQHGSFLPLYGLTEMPAEWSEEQVRMFEDVSPIHHLTQDDPPVMLIYTQPNTPPDQPIVGGQAVHHPRFGIVLKSRMAPLGLECVLQYPGHVDPDCPPDHGEDRLAFFKRHFGMDVGLGVSP